MKTENFFIYCKGNAIYLHSKQIKHNLVFDGIEFTIYLRLQNPPNTSHKTSRGNTIKRKRGKYSLPA